MNKTIDLSSLVTTDEKICILIDHLANISKTRLVNVYMNNNMYLEFVHYMRESWQKRFNTDPVDGKASIPKFGNIIFKLDNTMEKNIVNLTDYT